MELGNGLFTHVYINTHPEPILDVSYVYSIFIFLLSVVCMSASGGYL